MGITKFKNFIWGENNILRLCVTTLYPTIYSPNENFEYSYPLIV